VPVVQKSAQECENKRDSWKTRGTLERLKVGTSVEEAQHPYYTPGILYEYQDKGVTQFAIRKRLKRKEGQST
jgi:ribosomal protein L31